MKRHTGNKHSPIWLIGDSEPSNWSNKLNDPLDPRHPTRHNIWTSVLHYLNTELYKTYGCILNEDNMYTRNAVGNRSNRPRNNSVEWNSKHIKSVIYQYQAMLNSLEDKHPMIIFTFGSFAYEFIRRAHGSYGKQYEYAFWTTCKLGDQFRSALYEFDPSKINIFPLLHLSIARGRFLQAHRNYTQSKPSRANYFHYVAEALASKLQAVPADSGIWLQRDGQQMCKM